MIARSQLQNDLEPILLESGLPPAGVEILINLALGSARMEDLKNNAKLLPSEDLGEYVSMLEKRKLISSSVDDDGRFKLVESEELFARLPGPAGARLVLLATQAQREFVGGMTINPAMPIGDTRLLSPFEAYRNTLDARLPQVEIKVQTSCNIGCLYCFIRKDPRDTLDTVVARTGIERARSGGVERLILTGGEPTLRKDLPELIRHARERGFVDVQLFTNGLIFAYADRLDACIRAGLTSVVLHVSSVDRNIYARLTGRDHLETVKQAMHNLARYPQLEMAIVTVINRLNIHNLAETIDFFRDWQEKTHFAWFANEIPFCCVYSRAWDNRDKVLMPIEQALGVLEAIVREHDGETWPLLFYGIPYCLLPGLESNSYDLYFTMARQLLPEKNFDYTFLDAMFLKSDKCRRCRHEPYCLGISRGYARLYGSDILQPVI
jgi:organic radical activating enzyme